MEQTLSTRPQTPSPDRVRQDLDRIVAALGARDIRLVAASPCNWPDFARLDRSDVVAGDGGLIRVAVWSASSICTALMHSRRATILAGHDDAAELRCMVAAVARLDTARPLTGFLLRPVARIEADTVRRSMSAPAKDKMQHRGETRLALLDAFPVHPNGEEEPPGQP